MGVCDSQYPDHLLANDVGNVVRKYLQVYSPIATRTQTRHFMVSFNPSDVLVKFVPKSMTQAAQLTFVIRNRVCQLRLRV